MSFSALFGEAKSLGFFIDRPFDLPRYSWLYVPVDLSEVSLNTLCVATAIDAREMSDDEYATFEASAVEAGLKCFLNLDQIEDVLSNLRAQKSDFTREVSLAINHYWKHDAFVHLRAD